MAVQQQKSNGGLWATKVHPAGQESKDGGNVANKDATTEQKLNYKLEFKEFGGNATLHGLRYVADSDMHILRR